MATKLTLYIDDTHAKAAKEYAKQKGVSLSKVVNDFFSLLRSDSDTGQTPEAPVSSSLRGILKTQRPDEKDYKHYLESKYL